MPQENNNLMIQESFAQGLALQQQKNWDEALTAYQKTLDQGREEMADVQASVIYYNMAVIAREKGDFLKAFVWSKKSLHLDAGNSTAQQFFEQISKQFQPPTISHQISNLQHVEKVAAKIPQDVFYVFTVLTLLVLVWVMCKNLIDKRKVYLSGQFEQIRNWPVLVVLALNLVMLTLSALVYFNSQKKFALILVDRTPVQTVQGENKPVIFEAPAGLEVEVMATEETYAHIKYAGAFSGWVSRANLEFLSLSFKQENN